MSVLINLTLVFGLKQYDLASYETFIIKLYTRNNILKFSKIYEKHLHDFLITIFFQFLPAYRTR